MSSDHNAERRTSREFNHDCLFHLATCPGCHGAPTPEVGNSERVGEMDLTYFSPFIHSVHDEAYDSGLTGEVSIELSVLRPRNAFINRESMKEEFYRVYFPAGRVDDTDFMYVHFLPRELFQETDPTMDSVIDALCLVQLGISHSNENLINQARQCHQIAVKNLQSDLMNPSSIYDDHVLGAVYLLGMCEIFQAFSTDGQYRWTYHTQLSKILQSRGPNERYSKFAQVMVYGFRQLATIRGCFERKSVPFAGRAWKNCAALTTGIMAELGEQLIKLPGALERADRVVNQTRPSDQDILNAIIQLASMERDMQTWIVKFYSTFESLPFWPEKVENFPEFTKHISGAPTVFPKALVFPSFSHASAQASHWIGLLQVKRAMLILNRLRTVPFLPKSEGALIAEATECAEKLCESTAYLVQPRHGLCGILRAGGPLYYASGWFVKQGAAQNVAWCDVVRKSIQQCAGFVQMLPDR